MEDEIVRKWNEGKENPRTPIGFMTMHHQNCHDLFIELVKIRPPERYQKRKKYL